MPLSRKLGTLTSWNTLGPSGPVTRLLYLYLLQAHHLRGGGGCGGGGGGGGGGVFLFSTSSSLRKVPSVFITVFKYRCQEILMIRMTSN